MPTDSIVEQPQFKRCSKGDKCIHPDGPLLPATREYFHINNHSVSGFRSACKVCRSVAQPKPIDVWLLQGLKMCGNPDCPCDNPQPIGNFAKETRVKTGLSNKCYTCLRNYNRQWRDDNREHLRQTKHAWNKKNTEKMNKSYSLWREANPDKAKAARRKWVIKNPDKVRATWNRRQARKLALPNDFYEIDWQRCLDYWGGRCAYCGNTVGLFRNMKIVMEHFIPLGNPDCPGTVPENILPACVHCNVSKNNRNHKQWLIAKFGEKQAKKILKRIHDYFDSLRE